MTATVSEVVRGYKDLTSQDQRVVRTRLELMTSHGPAPLPPPPDDVVQPTTHLLVGTSVLGTESEREKSSGLQAVFKGSAANVAALESTATALAKWWASAIGAGGVLSWVAAWNLSVADYWADASGGERAVVVAAAAVTVVAVVFSIAAIIGADMRARSTASVGQYNARATIAEAYMKAQATKSDLVTQQLALLAAFTSATAQGTQLHMKTAAGDFVVAYATSDEGVLRVKGPDPADSWVAVPPGAVFSVK